MDYKAPLIGELHDGKTDLWLKVLVATTSLCPCHKRISRMGGPRVESDRGRFRHVRQRRDSYQD